ncbi:hypothetical protein QBC34DRAFT_141842 [Podospora aff. communis PSN243]|uniref:Uncharacterized protein n=1 Tax=Podospora aff. communis PSN243 TaxID=3040156 RepID=A0AAV9GFV6_9PEZI|nr:hypothetical protein QBC34DRAFT_141842 [Podospora aff. communis PSN243]
MSAAFSANALRGGSRALTLFRTRPVQRRFLSSTQFRQASKIIHFTKCSSPELDETLKTIREQLILPEYLPLEQRKKLYNRRYKDALERDPITVEIDGEVVQFGPRNLLDLPNTKKSVSKALSLMETKADFANLRPLLEGVCEQAGRALPTVLFEKIIRKAVVLDCFNTVMDCIKAPKKTHFRLNSHALVACMLYFIQRQAIMSGWDEAEIERATKRIQVILDLLESDPEHQVKQYKAQERVTLGFPLYRDPMFLAARLHMQSAFALKYGDGKDKNGLVAKYARQLVGLWPEKHGLLKLQPKAAYTHGGVRYLENRLQQFGHASLVLSSLRLAAKVVEPELSAQLKARADLVEPLVTENFPKVELQHSGSWYAETYPKLFGPGSLLDGTVKA